ncbi:O-antigen ligase family protein [Paenibacillus lautus]|nr:O-antigen ligase family protein [Paenibacillus lautus]
MFYMVYKKSSEYGLLNAKFVTCSILSIFGMGVIQTYVVEQTFGSELSRFTGFMASQPYAGFLVGSIALVLWNTKYTLANKVFLNVILLTGLLLNGSRTWFIGACILYAIYAFVRSKASSLHIGLVAASIGIGVASVALFFNYAVENQEKLAESNRLFVGFYSLIGTTNEDNSGTIGFRQIMNAGMINELKNSSLSEIVFGHGTSSSEFVARIYHPFQFNKDVIDSNRVVHNEWLRILYEFGILGMLLWVSIMFSSFTYLLKTGARLTPIISFTLCLLVAFTTENVIMSAGSVGIFAILILTAVRRPPLLKPIKSINILPAKGFIT